MREGFRLRRVLGNQVVGELFERSNKMGAGSWDDDCGLRREKVVI